MAMPEEREFFLTRTRRDQHPVGPPLTGAQHLRVFAEEQRVELIHHRLKRQLAFARGGNPISLAGGEHVLHHLAQRRELAAVRINSRRLERGEKTVINRFVIHEEIHRRCGRHGREFRDLLRRAPKPGAFQQMRGAFVVPIFRGDRRQVVDPPGGRICFGAQSGRRSHAADEHGNSDNATKRFHGVANEFNSEIEKGARLPRAWFSAPSRKTPDAQNFPTLVSAPTPEAEREGASSNVWGGRAPRDFGV